MRSLLRSYMETSITISRMEFIESHYSNKKDDFLDKLSLLWEIPLSKYINKEVYSSKEAQKEILFSEDKKIEPDWNGVDNLTKSPLKLKTHDVLDIMLNEYSVQDLMIIINFTMRNRVLIENKLGPRKLKKEKYKGLELILNEWKDQVNNPKTHDSLQELISKFKFRNKLGKSLSKELIHDVSKSPLEISKLVDDYCKAYLIVAKIQQVRRLRKGSSKNPGNISLADNILEDTWKLFDSIDESNKHKIAPHSITPTINLDFIIIMQHHLNNNRRYNSRDPLFSPSSSPDSNFENFKLDYFGDKILDEITKNGSPPWAEIYFWWYLRIKSKFFKCRLDAVKKSEFDKKKLKHNKSLNHQKQGYLNEIEKQEMENMDPNKKNKLIDGFKEISEYLVKELESSGNPLTTLSSKAKIKAANKEMSSSEIQALYQTRKEYRKQSKLKIRDLMSILQSDGEIISTNLTNPFIDTGTTQPICLKYDPINKEFFASNLVPRDKTSLINNCRNAIRNANLSLRYLQSRNNFKSLILQIITLIQLIIKLRVNLQDSRIYRYKFQDSTKSHVWSNNRDKLEKELFDELSKTLISILKNIQGQLEDKNSIYELLKHWIKQIEQIPDKLYIPNSMNPSRKIGRLGMLCDVLSSFFGLIKISDKYPVQVKNKIILYKMTDFHTITLSNGKIDNNKRWEPTKEKFIEITTEDLNLKPVGETLVD